MGDMRTGFPLTFDQRLQKVLEGKAYSAATQTGTASPTFTAIRVHNRKNSLKTVTVTGLWIAATTGLDGTLTNDTVHIQAPATPDAGNFTGIPTTLTAFGRIPGQAKAVAVVDIDSNSIASIPNAAMRVGLGTGNPVFIPLGIILPPDSSVEIEFANVTGGVFHAFTVEWFEE